MRILFSRFFVKLNRTRWAYFLITAATLFGGFLLLPVQIPQAPLATTVFARDHHLLGAHIASDEQWRMPLSSPPPQKFVTALLRYEDQRFYWHPGVDFIALLRAARSNFKAGKIVSGASTLSMQLVRLSRNNPPRTFTEKLFEIVLALRLEFAFDKQKILTLYAQYAPFGGNVVGIEAAAWRYFGRAPAELSWAEAAMLAVLPNSPALVHPGRERATLRNKRNTLLRALHQDGLLTATDLRLAELEILPDQVRPLPRLSSHLVQTLHQREPGRAYNTTLDYSVQQSSALQLNIAAQQLAQEGILNTALLIIDNRDLSVVAYHGNSELPQKQRGESVDIVFKPRSSGSILKPLLYAFMLQAGEITPKMLVADLPTQINGYKPENFDRQYRGAVPADEALALSLNIPAVRLLRQHGITRFYQELNALGLTTLFRPADDYGLTLILGGAETNLWDMAQSYAQLAVISTQQNRVPAYTPLTLFVKNSPTLTAATKADFGAGAAWLTLQAMMEVNRPGVDNYWREFSGSRKVAWKTGTSFGLRDAWAVAVTPAYTIAVWAGNASGEGVAGLSGTQSAAPLLFAVLNQLPDSGWFEEPLLDLRTVEICADDGYLLTQGCTAKQIKLPRNSHFAQISNWHKQIYLSASGNYRVHTGCESEKNMRPASLLQLPPGMAHYYRRWHPQYRDLPPWRKDCVIQENANQVMEFLYPEQGAEIFLPVDMDGKQKPLIAEAVHSEASASLHWHLDENYLARTRDFHQLAFIAMPGKHRLTIVDDRGRKITRWFTVIAREY